MNVIDVIILFIVIDVTVGFIIIIDVIINFIMTRTIEIIINLDIL